MKGTGEKGGAYSENEDDLWKRECQLFNRITFEAKSLLSGGGRKEIGVVAFHHHRMEREGILRERRSFILPNAGERRGDSERGWLRGFDVQGRGRTRPAHELAVPKSNPSSGEVIRKMLEYIDRRTPIRQEKVDLGRTTRGIRKEKPVNWGNRKCRNRRLNQQ